MSNRLGNIEDKHIMVKIGEFNTLDNYARSLLLTIFSKLITDGEFFHNIIGGDNIDVKNCTLTTHIAIQPLSYGRLLNNNIMWNSLAKDRFIRFFMLNPIRKDTIKKPPNIIDLKMSNKDRIYVNTDINLVTSTFQKQVSIGRARTTAIDITKSLASIMGYKSVNETVVKFFDVFFKPYLDLIPSLEYRESLGHEPKVNSSSINLISAVSEIQTVDKAWVDSNPMDNKDLSLTNYLNVTRQTVNEASKYLIENNILKESRWKHDNRYKYLELSGLYNDLFHLIDKRF